MVEPNEAYEGALDYIFVSYAHKDKQTVFPRIKALQDAGYRIWYDNGIELGSEWDGYIIDHVQRCACFLLFLSENSANSQYCGREISTASNGTRNFVVINMDGINLEKTHGALYGSLKDYQWVFRNAFATDIDFDKALSALPTLESTRDICETREDGDDLILVRYVGGSACPQLPRGITKIGDYAIIAPRAKAITLPEGVTEIGSSAFASCALLETVHLPDSVKKIAKDAFNGCVSLAEFALPESLERIGDSAFRNCVHLKKIDFSGQGEKIDVGNWAFCGCSNLTVVLGSRLYSIKANSIVGVSTLEEGPDYQAADAPAPTLHFALVGPLLIEKGLKNALILCLDKGIIEATVPEGVCDISSHAFEGCASLRSCNIPDTVTYISYDAFKGCTSLQGITLPNSVKEIFSSAFEDCISLKQVKLSESLVKIGSSAFQNCPLLEEIYIPESVTEIGSSAFENCLSLKGIALPQSVVKLGYAAFQGCSALENAHILGPVTAVDSFCKCSSLKMIDIPTSVTEIGSYAFGKCSSLESVTIPESVVAIGPSAFDGCSSLATMNLPESLTKIEQRAFFNCRHLQKCVLPERLSALGWDAFYGCTLLDLAVPAHTIIDEMRVPLGLHGLSFAQGSPYECEGTALKIREGASVPDPLPLGFYSNTPIGRYRLALENDAQTLLDETAKALETYKNHFSIDELRQIELDRKFLEETLSNQRGATIKTGSDMLEPAIATLQSSSKNLLSLSCAAKAQ